MTDSNSSRSGLGVLGFGAAACAACCAGPILAFLGGVGVFSIASTALIGWLGLLIVAAALGSWIVVRRRRASCAPPVETITLPSPTVRTPQPTEQR